MQDNQATRCDGCKQTAERAGVIHLLDGGGGHLCAACWEREMEWRRIRNAEGMAYPYSIESWPSDSEPIPT